MKKRNKIILTIIITIILGAVLGFIIFKCTNKGEEGMVVQNINLENMGNELFDKISLNSCNRFNFIDSKNIKYDDLENDVRLAAAFNVACNDKDECSVKEFEKVYEQLFNEDKIKYEKFYLYDEYRECEKDGKNIVCNEKEDNKEKDCANYDLVKLDSSEFKDEKIILTIKYLRVENNTAVYSDPDMKNKIDGYEYIKDNGDDLVSIFDKYSDEAAVYEVVFKTRKAGIYDADNFYWYETKLVTK